MAAGSATKERDNCLDKFNLDDQRSFAYLVENKSGTEHGTKQNIKNNIKKTKIPSSSISNENINEINDYQHKRDEFEVPNDKPLFVHQEGVTQNNLNVCKEYNVNEDFESVNSFFENEFKSDSQNHLQSSSSSDPLHISTDLISKLKEKAQIVNLEENDTFASKGKINKNEDKRKIQKDTSNAKENKKIKTNHFSDNNSLVLSKYMKKTQQYSFPCSLCFRHFVHPYDCLVHMITKACIRVSSHLYRTGKGLTCKTCGKTNFKSSKEAEKHAHMHEKDKFKACPVCSQQFSPGSVRLMIKHVQENHKKYLNTLNIRKWVRHNNTENNEIKCEKVNTVLQVNEQLASISKPQEPPKILQNLLWGKKKSCDKSKFENIQNQSEGIISESNVRDRPLTDLANSDLDSLPVTYGKFTPISPNPLLSTSVNSSECVTKSEGKTEKTLSNLKDISLSEENNEHMCEDKSISKFRLENRTKDETVITDDLERNNQSSEEMSNSHEEDDDDLFFGTCFCESKCKIHKDLSTNKLENCDISDEVLEDLFSCPDCIHTCGMDEEYNISTSITPTSSSVSGHRKKSKQCPYCDKKYESNYKLKIHLYTHSGERPFVCDICGHGFARRPNLMAHYRVHTGAKEYPCTKCDRTFGHPSDRIAHLINRVCDRAIHVKETEDGWQCITCGKSEFKSYNQAERHGRTHESAHVKKCPVCQEEFRGRKLHPLVKHVRSCHPEYLQELGV